MQVEGKKVAANVELGVVVTAFSKFKLFQKYLQLLQFPEMTVLSVVSKTVFPASLLVHDK